MRRLVPWCSSGDPYDYIKQFEGTIDEYHECGISVIQTYARTHLVSLLENLHYAPSEAKEKEIKELLRRGKACFHFQIDGKLTVFFLQGQTKGW
jgi:hypothetical protein